MSPEVEQELAHTLLIELLAHQFTYPVRWIETQNVILRGMNTERIVEIGPGNTLTNMTQKTMTQDPDAWDEVHALSTQLLAYEKDRETLYYEQRESEKDSGEVKKAVMETEDPCKEQHRSVQPVPVAKQTTIHEVEDVCLNALQVIRTICAQKLKKPMLKVETSTTIQSLAAGRSTVQNEIIGDLEKEFSALPNDSETTPLPDLARMLQDSMNDSLGQVTQLLVERTVSAKFPAHMTVGLLRKTFQKRWGFGRGRQDALLLRCVSQQPSIRLTSEKVADDFLQSLVEEYAIESNLDLNQASETWSQEGTMSHMSPEQMLQLTKRHDVLARRQIDLYADQIGLNLREDTETLQKLQPVLEEHRRQLDLFNLELGEPYQMGIVAKFDAAKVRTYDSSWAWGLQDLFELSHLLALSPKQRSIQQVARQAHHLVNCAGVRLERVLDYHMALASTDLESREVFAALKHLMGQNGESRKPVAIIAAPFTRPATYIDSQGTIVYEEVGRNCSSTPEAWATRLLERSDVAMYVWGCARAEPTTKAQMLATALLRDQLRAPRRQVWRHDHELTFEFVQSLVRGISLPDQCVLLTGAGKDSIGEEMLKYLMSAGAHVIVGTSSFSYETTRHFREIYTNFGASSARLTLAPFSQGSRHDCETLIQYIYDSGWDLDSVIPFAALSTNGRNIDDIDSMSELAHRIMLTNAVRLLGEIKKQKEARSIHCRPAQVILPLSGNHGDFGGDGLYAEAKAALETLFNKWASENWSDYLSLCGAIIGWTRGTGLMHGNNIVASDVEKMGARTFSRQEMAFLITSLLTTNIRSQCENQPLLADLNGGLGDIESLSYILHDIRAQVRNVSESQKAVLCDAEQDKRIVGNATIAAAVTIQPRVSLDLAFPELPDYSKDIRLLASNLKDMVDLTRVVVITGFAEVNPFGNARTRWDMEASGEFSTSGCVELAAMTGLIKYFTGTLKGSPYSGWLDVKSGEPVSESDIKLRYETSLLSTTGIRILKDRDGAPPRWETLHEVLVQEDMASFELPRMVADDLKRHHGANIQLTQSQDDDTCIVRIKKGAKCLLPKSAKYNPQVAGQLPDHWNARYFGVPDDILAQVDPSTLYVLVCAAETLVTSGITDPYEFYRYIHVSDFGNCIGSGLGGTEALEKMFKHRYLDKDVQNDILQETFVNTAAAWVNLLLLSSSGPNRTPVGACATALESLETGFENITTGKAKVCLVGGFDTIQENTAHEFGNMGATVKAGDDFDRGRVAKEMSRPTTSTRCGFVESEGSGMQILTSAALAIEMGLPIYGIVALVEGASDKIGRSIPAPGSGVMTNVRETAWTRPPPLLDMEYRRRLRDVRLRQIDESLQLGFDYINAECQPTSDASDSGKAGRMELEREVLLEAAKQRREVLFQLGNNFWKEDDRISPMRGALATWGLTIDDVGVASLHGTSTKKNDENETRVLHEQLGRLGRHPGNPILAVCQKYLTGHPKGAAGAWMVNGCLQILSSGFVPGNANADNIDTTLKQYDNVAFLNRGVQTKGIKACSVTSFGFGQKGYQAILVHPKYVFASLEESVFQAYRTKATRRARKGAAHFNEALTTNSLFRAKSEAPYTQGAELDFLTNPEARWRF